MSVSKLANAADISRATFYTHFADLEDVALSLYEAALQQITEREALTLDFKHPTGQDFHEVRHGSMDDLVEHFNTNRRLYASLLTVSQSRAIEARIAETIEASIMYVHHDRFLAPQNIQLQPIAHMLSAGFTRLLCDWVTDKVVLTPEEMTDHLLELMPEWLRKPAE